MKKIGVIIADEYEFEPFITLCKKRSGILGEVRGKRTAEFKIGDNAVTGIECGIGKVNAACETAFFISEGKADIIMNIGLSGAISGLKRDDFIAGESFVECDFDLTPIGYKYGEKPQKTYIYEADRELLGLAKECGAEKSGKFGCGDIFLADKEKKQFFKETFGICEFDMETGAIASVCHECGVPLLSIRKISDTADDMSGGDYKEMNDKAEGDLVDILERIIEKIE